MKARPHHLEQRRFLRVSTDLVVKYWFLDHRGKCIGDQPSPGVARNISKGGMELMAEVPPESLISDLILQLVADLVEVPLPNTDEPVRAVARVAWCEPRTVTPPRYHIGLEFREITQAKQDKIVDFIINERIRA